MGVWETVLLALDIWSWVVRAGHDLIPGYCARLGQTMASQRTGACIKVYCREQQYICSREDNALDVMRQNAAARKENLSVGADFGDN
jgi:hypothetical protein